MRSQKVHHNREKNGFFPLLYYFFADHVTQGNSDEGFFHAIYMLKYKGKRNYSLESLQDVGVAIFLNPQLDHCLAIVIELPRVNRRLISII